MAAALSEPERMVLVLGGDCTVGIATMAGIRRALGPVALAYFDLHSDLNILDVDVVDFTDAPLSEHPSRNVGLKLDEMLSALTVLASGSGLVGITLAELNPTTPRLTRGCWTASPYDSLRRSRARRMTKFRRDHNWTEPNRIARQVILGLQRCPSATEEWKSLLRRFRAGLPPNISRQKPPFEGRGKASP